MKNRLLIPLVTLLIGFLLIGGGITGYVVSENCCYPPDCEPENMCDFKESNQRYSASLNIANYSVYIGEILVLVSIIMYVVMYRHDKKLLK
ncbi:MAG: hypothetical protein KJ968_03725 [Nanoarchaeota archaeon]|nr:hypothetical protein [Nanoarchaeota archaeon]